MWKRNITNNKEYPLYILRICNAVPMYDDPRPTGSDCEVYEAQEYWESDVSK